MHCALKYDFVSRVVMASRSMASSSNTKAKVHEHLRKLYGQSKMSNQKLRAVDVFQNGMNLAEVACRLCIQLATAEIYLIDGLVPGENTDYHRLGSLLNVTGDVFLLLRQILLEKLWLKEVKRSCTGFSYNQIRFFLACLIRGS